VVARRTLIGVPASCRSNSGSNGRETRSSGSEDRYPAMVFGIRIPSRLGNSECNHWSSYCRGMTLCCLLPLAAGGRAKMADDPRALELDAAVIEIATLTASVGADSVDPGMERYSIGPSTILMGEEAAKSILAHLPKPVRCEAKNAGRQVVVDCVPIQRGGGPHYVGGALPEDTDPFIDASFDFLGSRDGAPSSTARVLCVIRGVHPRQLVTSVAAAIRWQHGYAHRGLGAPTVVIDDVTGGYATRHGYTADAARSKAVAIMDVSFEMTMGSSQFRELGEKSRGDTVSASADSVEKAHLTTFAARYMANPFATTDSTLLSWMHDLATTMKHVWHDQRRPDAVQRFIDRYSDSR
jgi:hypothetical protein